MAFCTLIESIQLFMLMYYMCPLIFHKYKIKDVLPIRIADTWVLSIVHTSKEFLKKDPDDMASIFIGAATCRTAVID
jgi:hypothetical protein